MVLCIDVAHHRSYQDYQTLLTIHPHYQWRCIWALHIYKKILFQELGYSGGYVIMYRFGLTPLGIMVNSHKMYLLPSFVSSNRPVVMLFGKTIHILGYSSSLWPILLTILHFLHAFTTNLHLLYMVVPVELLTNFYQCLVLPISWCNSSMMFSL